MPDEKEGLKAEILKKIEELAVHIAEENEKLSSLKTALAVCLGKFNIGDTISFSPGRKTSRKGVIIELSPWGGDDVTYVVRIIRKDGSLGTVYKVPPYMSPKLEHSGDKGIMMEGK